MRLLVLLSVALLSSIGCQEIRLYDPPAAGVYEQTVIMVDSVAEVTKLCKRNDAIACAYMTESPCVMVFNRHTWERYSTHEAGHCYQVNQFH